MNSRCLFLLLLLSSLVSHGQIVKVNLIQQGISNSDSSYYDAARIGENRYWLGGKYGVLTEYIPGQAPMPVPYPKSGADILNIGKFSDSLIMLCGDKGYLYFYNLFSKTWQVKQLEGYEQDCLYHLLVTNDSTAFICGGRSGIAHAEKVLPRGFIIKTTDRGRTWKNVYSSIFKMVWKLHSPTADSISAIVYTPNRSKLIAASGRGEQWKKSGISFRGLYHDYFTNNNKGFTGVGGKNFKLKKSGIVSVDGSRRNTFKRTGFLWDYSSTPKFEVATGCNGYILYRFPGLKWQQYQIPGMDKHNLYETCIIDDNTAIAVGSNKRIYTISFTTLSVLLK